MQRLILATVVTALSAANALDISGLVLDKRFAAITGAKVCAASTPDFCALSGSDGSFHLQGNVGLRAVPSLDPTRIHLRWFDAEGRRLAFGPSGESRNASRFYGPGFAEETALSPTFAGSRESGPLEKTAAPAALSVSKSGYASSTFQPSAEIETGDIIILGGAGETVVPLFNGKTTDGWTQIPAASWVIKDSAMASTGAGRGVAYSKDDYLDYRVIFSLRQVVGDHNPCVLFFGTRPPAGQNGMDALGAVQWQPPTVWGWDYRPGKNNDAAAYYTKETDPGLNRNQWSQCEILVHGTIGEARMACCKETAGTPCKAKEMLRFKDPAAAGRKGPFALQMHNAGIHDEYRNISIETNPKSDSLFITQ